MARCPRSMILYPTTRCGQMCLQRLVRNSYTGDADKQLSIEIVREFAKLGGKYIGLAGGDPTLVIWLSEIMEVCRSVGLYSDITLSGSAIERAQDYLKLPTLLRVSIDGCAQTHDLNRGHGSYAKTVAGLEAIRTKRAGMKTQLVFTAIPGPDGNLKWHELESVLSLAREYGVMVNVNPVFGILNRFAREEFEMLLWFARQSEVQMSRGKLRFLRCGGNNDANPTCLAMQTTITIAPDGRMVLPCFHHRIENIDLRNGLKSALQSKARINLLREEGMFSFCKGCTIWCYIVPSMLTSFGFPRLHDRAFVWMHGLSGLQSCRDSILRLCGSIRTGHPYPDFRLPNS